MILQKVFFLVGMGAVIVSLINKDSYLLGLGILLWSIMLIIEVEKIRRDIRKIKRKGGKK